ATETIQTTIEQSTDELPNLVDGRNKPLVIILAEFNKNCVVTNSYDIEYP
ncbi:unnamed protein product, partial [Rotaria socialis]